MTRRRDFEVETHRGDAELVPLGEKYAIPAEFEATITPHDREQPVCHLTVALEAGRPVCTALRLERQGPGARITTVNVRVPVSEFIRAAIDSSRIGHLRLEGPGPVTITAFGETVPHPYESTADGHVAVPIGGAGRTPEYGDAARRRRRVIDDDLLRGVASRYREALAAGEGPTQAIADEEYVSRSTASRWVKQAREAGHLGAPLHRVAGERPPSS